MHPLPNGHRVRERGSHRITDLTGVLCATSLVAFCANVVQAQVCVPEDCLPSPNSSYSSTFDYHFSQGTTLDLDNLVLHGFTSCWSPPSTPGSPTILQFSASVDFDASTNGGPVTPGQASAQVTIAVRFDNQSGPTRYFDTEVLQLDISGGTLPAATMLREAPTLASLGQVSIEALGGGSFRVESFFDVFLELSFDGGQTWVPSSTGPGRTALTGPECPTAIEAGTWTAIKRIYR